MAKKTKQHEPFADNFNVDDQWDDTERWDDFESDFGDIDVPMGDKDSKSRKPQSNLGVYATSALKGTSLGVLKGLRDDIRKGTPAISDVADDAMGFIDSFSEIKQDLLKNSSQLVTQTKQLARAVSPKLGKILPEKFRKKLEEFSKEEETEHEQTLEERRKSIADEEIKKALNFQVAQAVEESEERRLDTAIDRKVSAKRHEGLMEMLSGIHKEAEWQTEFYKSVVTGYFTKSLELKYQHVFLTKDILGTMQTAFKSFDAKLDGILKNSGLPDIQKQRLTESYKNVARGALMKKFNDKISFSLRNSDIVKNIKSKLNENIENIGMILDQAQQMNDMAGMMDEMKELGMGVNEPSMMASMGIDMGSSELAKFITKHTNPAVRAQLAKFLLKGPEQVFRGYKQKIASGIKHRAEFDEETINDDDKFLTKVRKGGMNAFFRLMDSAINSTDKVANTLANKPFDPTPFDIATRQSIVEVIPGYLGKILQQLTAINTGQMGEELVYDEQTRDFMSASKYTENLNTRLHTELRNGKRVNRGEGYGRSFAALAVGVRHSAKDAKESKDYIVNMRDVRKDLDTVVSNVAVSQLRIMPEWIKEYYDNDLDDEALYNDYNVPKYMGKLLKDVKNKKEVLRILVKAFFLPNGEVNTKTVNDFLEGVNNLASDDAYKEVLADVMASGKGRFITDTYFKNDTYGTGNFILNEEGVVKGIKQNYDKAANAKIAIDAQKEYGSEIRANGVSVEEMLTMLPDIIGKSIAKHISKETLEKRRFGIEQFNDLADYEDEYFTKKGKQELAADRAKRSKGKRKGTTTALARRLGGGIGTTADAGIMSVQVEGTLGEHVLIPYLDKIHESIAKQYTGNTTAKTNDAEDILTIRHTQITDLLSNIRDTLSLQLKQFAEYQQQFQAMSLATMESARIAAGGQANPDAWSALWRGVGNIGGGLLKGGGTALGATSKGIWGFAKSVTGGALKTIQTVLPGLSKGVGIAAGGLFQGAGSALGGLFGANAELAKFFGGKLWNLAGGATNLVKKGFNFLTTPVSDLRDKTIDRVKTAYGDAKDRVASKFRTLKGWSSEKISDLVERYKDVPGDIKKRFSSMTAIVREGMSEPLATIQDFAEGLYTKDENGQMKLVTSLKDIKGDLYTRAGELKVRAEDLAQSFMLTDKGELLDKLRSTVSTKASDLKNKIVEKATDKKSILGHIVSGGMKVAGETSKMMLGMNNKLFDMGLGALKWGGQTAGALIHRLLGLDKDKSGKGELIDTDILETYVTERLDKIIDYLDRIAPERVAGDTDNDGDREGSYQDYQQRAAERKAALAAKRAAKADKKEKEKDSGVNKEEGGLLSTLFYMFGGRKLLGMFKTLKSKLFGGMGFLLKKLLSAKGILGILGALFGASLFGSKDENGNATLSTGGAVAGAGTALAAGYGAKKLASMAATKMGLKSVAAASAAMPTAAAVAGVGTRVGSAVSGVGAAGAAAAAKNEGLLIRCLKWLKDKLPASWAKHLDKLATKAGPIMAKLSGSALGKVVARLAAGPIGWIIWVGDMAWEATKASWNPQQAINVSEDVSISLGDRFIIGLSGAIAKSLFLGFIDTDFIASILGVNIAQYKKKQEDLMDQKSHTRTQTAIMQSKMNTMKEHAGYNTSNMKQDPTQTGGQNTSQAQKHQEEQMKKDISFFDKAWNFTKSVFSSGDTSGAADTAAAGDASGWESHYKPGSLNGNQSNGSQSIGNTSAPADISEFANLKPVQTSGGNGKIGEYTKEYESGGKGAMAMAWDKTGGTSYGTYQLAAKTGVFKEFIDYIKKSNSPNKDIVLKAFSTVDQWDVGKDYNAKGPMVWKELAKKGYIQEFEHGFTKQDRYDKCLNAFPEDLRNAINSNRALQEMLWSTVVQHGPGQVGGKKGAIPIFLKCWRSGMPLDQFIKAVYQDRSGRFGSSTPEVRKSVQDRFKRECSKMLGLLGQPGITEEDGGASVAGNLNMPTDTGGGSGGDSGQSTGGAGGSPAGGDSGTGGGASAAAVDSATGSAASAGTDTSNVGENASSGGSSSSGGPIDTAATSAGGWESHYKPGSLNLNNDKTANAAAGGGVGDTNPQNIDKEGFTVSNCDFDNVNPNLKARFAAMAKEYYQQTGKKLRVTSGKRSMASQEKLYREKGPGLAAKPNPLAPHISGLALDINYRNPEINDQLEKMGLFQKYGLYRPLKNGLGRTKPEHWHIEPIGSRDPNAGMKITQATLSKFGSFDPKSGATANSPNDSATIDNSADGVAAQGVDPKQGDPGSSAAAQSVNASVSSGGAMTSSDATQSTSTGSTGGDAMSTLPAGGGAGTATSANMESSTPPATTGSSEPNTIVSPTDITPMTQLLTSINEVLGKIANNTGNLDVLNDMNKNMDAMAKDTGNVTPAGASGNDNVAPAGASGSNNVVFKQGAARSSRRDPADFFELLAMSDDDDDKPTTVRGRGGFKSGRVLDVSTRQPKAQQQYM